MAVKYKVTWAPARMSDRKGSFKERTKDNRVSAPLLVNWPSEKSVAGLRSDGISFQATPLVVGAIGMPVPSIHESDASQRISNDPTPRLNMGLGGVAISVSFNVARKMSQSCVASVESSEATTLLIEKRTRLSKAPFCWFEPLTAVGPETAIAPAPP